MDTIPGCNSHWCKSDPNGLRYALSRIYMSAMSCRISHREIHSLPALEDLLDMKGKTDIFGRAVSSCLDEIFWLWVCISHFHFAATPGQIYHLCLRTFCCRHPLVHLAALPEITPYRYRLIDLVLGATPQRYTRIYNLAAHPIQPYYPLPAHVRSEASPPECHLWLPALFLKYWLIWARCYVE
jgi:hypothetical protein